MTTNTPFGAPDVVIESEIITNAVANGKLTP